MEEENVAPAELNYIPMVDGELTDEHKALDPAWQENLEWLDMRIQAGDDLQELADSTLIPVEQLEIRKSKIG